MPDITHFGEYRTITVPERATPAEFLIDALRHPQLRLRAPLRVQVEREGEFVLVWNDQLRELGYGSYLTAAVEDFQQTLIELYFTLRGEQARLGSDMSRLWQELRRYVEERPDVPRVYPRSRHSASSIGCSDTLRGGSP